MLFRSERPEALEKGNFIISGISTGGLLQSVELAVQMNKDGEEGLSVPDYADMNCSMKVVKIVQSYTRIVNLMVWREMGKV